MENLIGTGAIAAIVFSGLKYLYQSSEQKISSDSNGQKELRVNKLFLYLGLLPIICIGIFWIGTLYYREEGMIIGALALSLFFGLFARYYLRLYNNHRVVFDEENIRITNKKGMTVDIKWNNISSIFYDALSMDICIAHEKGENSFSSLLVGINEFLEEMEKQTKWKAAELNLPNIN